MKFDFSLHRKFKATSVYKLTEWHHVTTHERQLIAGLYDEGEVYGVFQPATGNSSLTSKVAYKDVALLYMHLQHSDAIPRSFMLHGENTARQAIAQLVLDGILAIEDNGEFVSGTDAVCAIYGKSIFDSSTIPDHLSILSMNAIRYAFMLNDLDIRSLANRLYTYNATPMDAASRSSFDTINIYDFLFSKVGNEAKKKFQQNWQYTQPSFGNWIFWIRNNEKPMSDELQSYKLYISPQVKDLQDNFEKIISAIDISNAYCFKTGGTIKDLLRCDKMIVYFKNKNDLKKTAGELSGRLENCAVQGVPFTQQLDEKGILSAGVDPLKKDILKSIEGGSWRSTVTEKLATAILHAQQSKMDQPQAIEFVKAKLTASGIDVHKWMPLNDAI